MNSLSNPLPINYGDNQLVLLIRDPNCLFAYWEINCELVIMLEQYFHKPWSEIQLTVKIYGFDDDKESDRHNTLISKIVIEKQAGKWYFPVKSCRCFQVLLGIEDDGQFIPILKSNLVELSEPEQIIQTKLQIVRPEATQKCPESTAWNLDSYWHPLGIFSTIP